MAVFTSLFLLSRHHPTSAKNLIHLYLLDFLSVRLTPTNKTPVLLNFLVRLQVAGRGAVFIAIKSPSARMPRHLCRISE